MSERNVKDMVSILGLMTDAESRLAALYRACSRALPDDSEFWSGLAGAEEGHAKTIARMAQVVIANLGVGFEPNSRFNQAVVRTFSAGIQASMGEVEGGTLGGDRLYFVARDIESSLLEARYVDAVMTSDPEYKRLLEGVIEQTREHRAQLEEKVKGLKK